MNCPQLCGSPITIRSFFSEMVDFRLFLGHCGDTSEKSTVFEGPQWFLPTEQ